MLTESELQDRLEAFIATTPCPGASLGVIADGQMVTVAAGMLNTSTGYPATPDALFQIGSVTKTWTATMVLQLVEQGLVELDAAVQRYLPDFTLADADLASAITVRHLLTHTSGMEGDVFDDVGRNPDALERYVAALSGMGAVHDLGETWSYCNSGFVTLGRLIEVLRDATWEQTVQQLAASLGMGPVVTRADQAIVHRVAVGHLPDQDSGAINVAPMWSLPMALGPAGLVTTSVGDLLRFAKLHLDDGVTSDGTKLLSRDLVAEMQAVQAQCPEVDLLADSWGLGFWVKHWGPNPVIGHGGNTIGQSAYFDMVPAKGVAVALLTNVSGAAVEATDLVKSLLAELADVDAPPFPALPDVPAEIDLEPYVGTYRRYGLTLETVATDGQLQLHTAPVGFAVEMGAKPEIETLVARGPGQFLIAPKAEHAYPTPPVPVRFYGGPDGNKFIHAGGRASPRAT